jgi:RNA polymerase sigma factor (sigma-70 family)
VESKDNESELIKRINDGDSSAFQLLVEKHKDVSFTLASSILKDKAEAEDVLQEVFLKVFKNIKHFRADSSFKTWLFRIVVNTCLNVKAKTKAYIDVEALEFTASEQKEGLEILLEAERKIYVMKALELMKPDEALLLRLYYLGDLKIGEIKEVTDFSESNIKVILHRGRKNILAILKKIVGTELSSLL